MTRTMMLITAALSATALGGAAVAANAVMDRGTLPLDANRDGKFSLADLKPHHGRGQHGDDHHAGGQDLAPPPAGDPAAPGTGLPGRIDLNRDGRITRDEMRAQADQRFDRLDANRDGVIDQTEFAAARGHGGDASGRGRRGGWRQQGMDGMPPPPPPVPGNSN